MANFQGLRRSMVSLNANDHPELNVMITEEKDVMKELSRFAKEKVEAGKYMAVWGKTEHSDIEDITEKYLVLFEQFAKFHSDLIERYDCYRAKLKDMKSREDGLYILRKRLTELQGKYKEAIKRQKPTEALRAELESLDRDCNESGAAYEGFKRAIFKEAMHMQFDAWMDFGRKIMVFAQFGKYLSDQIPQGSLAPGQPLPAYEGAPVTTRIVNDFLKALRISEPASQANGNRRHSGTSSQFSLDNDPLPPPGSMPEGPQPPPKRYAAHQRHGSGDRLQGTSHSPVGGSPEMHASSRPISMLDPGRPVSMFYEPQRNSGSFLAPPATALPNSTPGSPRPQSPNLNSSRRYYQAPNPLPHSQSLPRTPDTPFSQSPRDSHFLPPTHSLPRQISVVTCPVCERHVIANLLNPHLDSACAMHLVEVTGNGALGYDEYDAQRQVRARQSMEGFRDGGEPLMTDEEIRQRLEAVRMNV